MTSRIETVGRPGTSAWLTGTGLLRAALRLDALVTGVNGLAYLVLAGPLGELFDMPEPLLRWLGAFLALFAAAVWLTATPQKPAAGAVLAVIAVNALWVVDSVVLLVTGAYEPSTVGSVWIGLQALTVAGLTGLQLAGRARARAAC